MIYLKTFTLAGQRQEELYINSFELRCFDSYYPLEVFPGKKLQEITFSDVTILSGSNGSGKSTLLNIISEKLKIPRISPYNKTYFMEPYVDM